MSYEIDCPHKIVSSPFCGPDSGEAYIHPRSRKRETNDRRRFIPSDIIEPSISPSAIRFMRTRSLQGAREYSWPQLSETNVT